MAVPAFMLLIATRTLAERIQPNIPTGGFFFTSGYVWSGSENDDRENSVESLSYRVLFTAEILLFWHGL